MKLFSSFSGILISGAIAVHLLLTAILFSSILMYVEKSYKDQFIDNVRTTSNMLANQSAIYLDKNDKTIEGFLDELLLSGTITHAEIEIKNAGTYLPQETSNSGVSFQEDFFFSQHDDNTYFIAAPIHTQKLNGVLKIGFDETLIQENIDTTYARGIYLATGYVVLVIILILIFIPRLTSSLRLLKSAAQKISSGNNNKSLKINTRIDEFTSLINSLETMRLSMLQQHKEVERKEIYIREITNRMADAMIVMNKEMIIQSLNSSAEKIFGFKSSEVTGTKFEKLLAPCSPKANCNNCEKLYIKANMAPSNENASLECRGMHKNGSTFPVELFYSNFDHDSEHIIICNAHDMTEHKKAKEILTEALQSAEEANNSKSIFLSSMSHELRTPLNAIIGYSEILLEEAQDKNDEATSSDLKKIRNSGKHLLSLINNVLDLSKIEAGKMDIDNQEFLVGQVIEDVMFTTRPLIEKNNNKFTLNFNDTDLTLFADFTKVKQALINLIGNAAKFTENGNITLNISLEKVSHKPSIRFDVVDTGIGIAEEDIGKLFKEFSQANAQVMTKYGGTGLGLIISRKFCQMMGGDITVKSELEKGSIFTMTLPLQTPPSSDYS